MTPAILAARFWNHLDVDADDMPYTLLSPLDYDSVLLQEHIQVPTGFTTDIASIPRLVQPLIPKEGKYNRPAVVHDDLYSTGNVNGTPITRKQADDVLAEAMRAANVDPDRARLIYLGVRVGGWYPWWKYRRAERQHGANRSVQQ